MAKRSMVLSNVACNDIHSSHLRAKIEAIHRMADIRPLKGRTPPCVLSSSHCCGMCTFLWFDRACCNFLSYIVSPRHGAVSNRMNEEGSHATLSQLTYRTQAVSADVANTSIHTAQANAPVHSAVDAALRRLATPFGHASTPSSMRYRDVSQKMSRYAIAFYTSTVAIALGPFGTSCHTTKSIYFLRLILLHDCTVPSF